MLLLSCSKAQATIHFEGSGHTLNSWLANMAESASVEFGWKVQRRS